ncbi:MAG: GNAT family N-acetyltransferase [Streptococcaceae bacterium]|jgi:ribosomal protein S18 acetylase RimI-like enzyme|nr:GNAT family N-acetyltransferase [Streptococcaceae bacterium]
MIIPTNNQFRAEINEYVRKDWSGPKIVSKGVVHDTSTLEAFISIDENQEVTGYIFYHIHEKKCEVIVLQSLVEAQGIGTALVNAVVEAAKAAGCLSVWLITTNDNIHALDFYQKRGFELTAVHFDAVAEARKLKPSIPLLSEKGIPIKHEFELSLKIG